MLINSSKLFFVHKILSLFVCLTVHANRKYNHLYTTPAYFYRSQFLETFFTPTFFDYSYIQLGSSNLNEDQYVNDQHYFNENNYLINLTHHKNGLTALNDGNRPTIKNEKQYEIIGNETSIIQFSKESKKKIEKKSYFQQDPDFQNLNYLKTEDMLATTERTANLDFSYDDQETWPGLCNDPYVLQSPIALSSLDSQLDLHAKLDIGIQYAKNLPTVELENNGHTVLFRIPKNVTDLIITGPVLDYEVYRLETIHFHWGSNDSVGSEHIIDGQRFSLEIHIVHYNIKYVNLEEALKHQDGTVVIAILYKIGKMNKAIDPLIRKLKKIQCKGQKTKLSGINILRLFSNKVERFYQYYGSLTTPPCTPTLNWIVIETANLISSVQLAKFRLLTGDDSCQKKNLRKWRNLQNLNNRHVRRSIKI